jgi:general secretion pathway protein A
MWGIKSEIMPYTNNIAESQVFFSIAAKQNGFLVQRIESDFELVEKLNLPAVLEFNSTEMPSAIYLAVCRIQDGLVLLKTRSDEEGITVETKQLQELYSGTAYIPWKNFYDYRGMLPINSSKETIVTLKMHIRDIGYDDIEINPEYDEKTKETIKNIQEKHGLPKDGLIGPLTKIILYNEVKRLNIPHIR